MARTWHVILALLACFTAVLSYNLDVHNPILYKGFPGEYFGYSVTLHKEINNGPLWVVVGAPLGNRTSKNNEREGYGSVLKCKPDKSDLDGCEAIPVDDKSEDYDTYNYPNGTGVSFLKEFKKGQWLGATVASARTETESLLACAPRYKYRGSLADDESPENRTTIVPGLVLGKCFLVRNRLDGVNTGGSFWPCHHSDLVREKDKDTGKFVLKEVYKSDEDGNCQAGFSAAMSKDGKKILLGMPGRFNVTGSVLYYLSKQKSEAKTGDLKYLSDGLAMGYAVSIGKFTYPDEEEYIGSSPVLTAKNLQGMVRAFKLKHTPGNNPEYSLEDSFALPLPSNVKFGSYFGASLCAVDLNNDGYSDLLVGAPYHNHGNGDEGRVYVYINTGQSPGKLNNVVSMTLNGSKTKGALFGYAMAEAGDLNNDGYPEVAISAPYGGKDQGGVVFIYFGTKDGIETTYRQVIEASDISPGVKTFGFSLAGNLDVDKNGYKDLAVGAYASDRAFLLRSRPIAQMEAKVTLIPNQISLEDDKAMTKANDGVLRKSIDVTVCFKYKAPMAMGKQDVTFKVTLDRDRFIGKVALRRLFFFQNNKKTYSISRNMSLTKTNEWECLQSFDTAFLLEKDKIQNLFNPLTFDLTYDLISSSSCVGPCPILLNHDKIAQRTVRAEVSLYKHCGVDKICNPDLSVKGEVKFGNGDQELLLIGVVDNITVTVMVENKAEDAAYPGTVIVTYPSVFDYARSTENISCSTNDLDDENKNAKCILGNPFKGNIKKQFEIVFSTRGVAIKENVNEFNIHLNASSGLVKDKDLSNNIQSLKVPVRVEADLRILGYSKPDQVVFSDNITDNVTTSNDIGPALTQTVSVRNLGPSPVEFAEVTIMVPFRYNKVENPKNYLLYLMELSVLGNAGSCNVKTNPLGLQRTTNSSNSSQPEVVEQTKESIAFKSKSVVNQSNEEVQCETDSDMTCLNISCSLGTMKKNQQANVQMVFRFWQSTLIKAKIESLNLTTTAKVVAPLFVIEPSKENNEVKVVLKANPKTAPKVKDKDVAAWIIVVSVIAGLLLIGLIVFALYKFGFFKRNQPHKNQEEATDEELQAMSTPPNQSENQA